MSKVVTMGEIMLRLSTPNFERFIQADEFDIHYGGGEANVAVSLANYGHAAEYVTAVPDNEIGECAIAALRKYNVGTAHIARCGEHISVAIFFGIGLLHLNEMAIGLGHRVIYRSEAGTEAAQNES